MKNCFKLLFLSLIMLVPLILASCSNNKIDLPSEDTEAQEELKENAGNNENKGNEEATSECKHEYEEKVLVAATCTKDGIAKKTCTLCKKSESLTISKVKHTEIIDAAIAATCTTEGKSEGKHCKVCNTVTVAQSPVAALGHTEVTDPAIAPTCTSFGMTEGKHCSVCNTVTVAQSPIAALGHTEITDPAIAPTCTSFGMTEGKHCKVCNTVTVAQSPVAALGHTEVTDPAIAPTCTSFGMTEGKHCSVCNTITIAQTPIATIAHTEAIDSAVDPTCTALGMTEGKHCSVCNTIIVAQAPIAALGHTEVIDSAIPATCTEDGKTEGKHCSVCNTVLVEQEIQASLGHTMVKRTVTALTCLEDGEIEEYCTGCELRQRQTIPKGHYPIDHEYTQIDELCLGHQNEDFCYYCEQHLISPITYTVFGKGGFEWNSHLLFNFSYYDEEGALHNASDLYYDGFNFIIDGEETSYDTLVITITETYFAEIDDYNYKKVFKIYSSEGEYALSDSYWWDENITRFKDLEQEINFSYSSENGVAANGTRISVVEDTPTEYEVRGVISFDNFPSAIYFVSDPGIEWGYAVDRHIYFGITPQTVSKEFFEWFISVASKTNATE